MKRSQRMVLMARTNNATSSSTDLLRKTDKKINKNSLSKENLLLPIRDINAEKFNKVEEKKSKLEIDYKFFKPVVPNETQTSLNAAINNMDLDMLKGYYMDEVDFDDHDSIEDPDYQPSNDENQDEIDLWDEIDLEAVGAEIEERISQEESTLPKKETKNIRQEKRNTGKEYITSKGKLVKARYVTKLEKCRNKCMEKISLEDQISVFNHYWGLGSYNLRIAFVSGMIDINQKKTERKNNETAKRRNRIYSYKYFVVVHGAKIQICQKCFKFTLCENEQFIKTVVEKKLESSGFTIDLDKRGKNTPKNKISNDKNNEVIEHIKSFPSYESHYSRSHSKKKYLQGDLNLSIMHRLYCDNVSNPVSLSKYSEIFKTLEIKFKKPSLDQCNTCELIKTKIKMACNEEEKSKLVKELELHHDAADRAYEEKREDKKIGVRDSTVKVYSFDLQQCLPTPFLRSSMFFYKRPLWTFNLTLHDCVTNNPDCFMWHEALARRGGNEIASCLFQKLSTLPITIKHIVLYSDSCSGQNKNSYVAAMFMTVMSLNPNIEIIDHKFLQPGHTHMECDSDHAIIEKKKKSSTVTINHPHDWYNFVTLCGVKRKFTVIEMKQESFLNFGEFGKQNFTWRKNDTNGNKINWRNIKWFRFTQDIGAIQFKNSLTHDEEFKLLNVKRRGAKTIELSNIPICYSDPIKISIEKKKDLIDMLPFVKTDFHNFYKNLVTDNLPNIDPDLLNEDEEAEEGQ